MFEAGPRVTGATRRARGALERALLELLWKHDAAVTAGDVQRELASAGDALALTTILTVLTRMERKGTVRREDVNGRAFYSPTRSETAAAAEQMLDALRTVHDRDGALQRFTGALSADDIEALRRALGE